jgi:AcrR family transcriptional regulator
VPRRARAATADGPGGGALLVWVLEGNGLGRRCHECYERAGFTAAGGRTHLTSGALPCRRSAAGCRRPTAHDGGATAGHQPRDGARIQYVRLMAQPVKSPRPQPAAQRLKVRRQLAAAAMELFATKGYAATTVDEIAASAGVARRTFFRHFRSKEEAIFPDHDDTLERAKAVLDAAPPRENPIDTVCRGIKEVMKMYAASPAVSFERYQLTREVPALREREIASVARYERLFTRYLLSQFDEHSHNGDEPLLAEVAASAVVTAHNHVLRRWLRRGGQGDVEAELDHAFAIVRRTFGSLPVFAGRRPGDPAVPAAPGQVLITVSRTDTPLPEVLRAIEDALHDRG